MSNRPLQKILFGSPGTGKSYKIAGKDNNGFADATIAKELGITDSKNIIKTVFHPEYTYGDFIGKLLPQTTDYNSVIYKYYSGYFLKALGRAYRNIIDENKDNVLLVIDELNRGNAPAIFGIVFQLLDRDKDGWSEYEVNISELEKYGLLDCMDYPTTITSNGLQVDGSRYEKFYETEKAKLNEDGVKVFNYINNNSIVIPPNLSIVATINTSDESIYYLDSAFKRRWDWEYIKAPSIEDLDNIPDEIKDINLIIGEDEEDKLNWGECIIALNEFIKNNHQKIKRIEDKQIGWYFINPSHYNNVKNEIELEDIKDKLMFYLWDNVFARDKSPLLQLIDLIDLEDRELITYNDFVENTRNFMQQIKKNFL